MFKVMFVLYERSGVDRDEALRYWRTEHADIVRKVPGVQRYVQNHAVASPESPVPFLGVAELVFADQEAFGAAAAAPEFGAAVADVANFADETRLPTAFAEEVVVV